MQNETPFVAVIGGANIDIHGKSEQPLRLNDSNPGTVITSAGGVARNVAENLARLGVDCRLIAVIGDDDHGRMLTKLSREAGVDTRCLQQIAGGRTATYVAVINATGDMQVAIADMGIMDRLSVERLQPQQTMLEQCNLIVLDSNLPADALAWITGTINAVPIFADTVSTSKAPRLKRGLGAIHTLKTNTIEAEALTGDQARTVPQLRRLATRLHHQGVERVFVTRGDQGVFYSTGDTQGTSKLRPGKRQVANASGAGDAFLAGLAYAWLQNLSLPQTLRFALTAADITLANSSASSPALSLTAVTLAMEARRAD
ncbi:MAG: carbohydrate kinase family protein [Gammaproteobacteria bacterium]|nr:carbohydrate kinase family protein [Gammaproteobacteria bacterium]